MASASRSRSATAGGSPSRGGESRSSATIARSSADAGWRLSTTTSSPERGISSASTTDGSSDRRSERQREDEKEAEEGDDEGECFDVGRAGCSLLLHVSTPDLTGPGRSI